MSEPLTLAPESVEAVAVRVAELLAGETSSSEDRSELVDAAEVARRFSVSRDWVYANADELGAVRLSAGPKARIRFDLERVIEALVPRPFTPTQPTARRKPRSQPPSAELLPIGGKR